MTKSKKPKSSKHSLVFFGNERLATGVSTDAPALRGLLNAGYHISAVVTNHNEAVSRSKRILEIVDVAHAYHVPVMMPDSPSSIAGQLAKMEAEAAVLVAYGRIIPQSVIDLFPKGIINIHPSLLPKLRGSTPIETAILNSLEETGVSLMKLAAEMDAGPVYAQKKLALSGNETKQELAAALLKEGVDLLLENLGDILSGRLEPKVQDETEATFTRQLSKQDGMIDFSEPAIVIEHKIRAFAGFPKARAKLFGRDTVITKARVAQDAHDGQLVIACQDSYLEVLELTAPSGRNMVGSEFIKGYKK